METGSQGIKGWLLVYVVFSIPVLMFYSAGLAGWFFDYPLVLFLAIFIFLAVPLMLIALKSPRAPEWNIAMLWIAAALIALRIIYGVLLQRRLEGQPPLRGEELLGAMPLLLGVVIFSLGWAVIWTKYFQKSVLVRSTFLDRS